jgi:hypothetical protein
MGRFFIGVFLSLLVVADRPEPHTPVRAPGFAEFMLGKSLGFGNQKCLPTWTWAQVLLLLHLYVTLFDFG